jgi:hypothetical protein
MPAKKGRFLPFFRILSHARPYHSKYSAVAPCAGTMQFGITIANARTINAIFINILANTKRLGEVVGMVT